MSRIRRALLSVTDKTGLAEFARVLSGLDVELISTGGTARLLREAGIAVRDVAEVTGFPEMLGGRVKTMHPRITGGILAVRSEPEHMRALEEHDIAPIDLVVVNLYAFEKTAAQPGARFEEIIENIDIGGPTMIRSAAKNFADVAVVTDPADYAPVAGELSSNGGELSQATRWRLAQKAFALTASYDRAISGTLAKLSISSAPSTPSISSAPDTPGISSAPDTPGISSAPGQPGASAAAGAPGSAPDTRGETEPVSLLPDVLDIRAPRRMHLRYGENPHQQASLYAQGDAGIAGARQLHGKELSYNNLVDLDAAWQLAQEFERPAAAIIKHTNPCGCAEQETQLAAYRKALECDPVSAFGSVIAFNRVLEGETAQAVAELFVEAIAAPGYGTEALERLQAKKNLRLIEVSGSGSGLVVKSISGGYLAQTEDSISLDPAKLKVASERAPTAQEMAALEFGWKVAKHVKSNAIVFAVAGQVVGVGAGQMSRVDSVKLAASKALLPLKNTVVASDAFFPFPDGVEELARHGATAVIQPGGSVRDADVIAAANRLGLAMVFTGIRHFRH